MPAKRTPLYHAFKARNAKMAVKAGFETADVFIDAASEHRAVRQAAGLFEIFGQVVLEVAGADAEAFLDGLMVPDMTRLGPDRGVYGGILNDAGGFIDDVITFRLDARTFWVIPAPHRVERIETLFKTAIGERRVHAVSLGYRYVSLSLQGPRARLCLQAATEADVSNEALPSFGHLCTSVAGVPGVHVTRTGFTGELGYELWVPTEYIEDFYDRLLDLGAGQGLVPCGSGSMGSLRIEKRFPIWGRDIDESVTPIEAGLGWTVRPKAADYPGKAVIEAQKRDGAPRRLVLLALPEGAPLPAGGTEVLADGHAIGKITSAAQGHSLGQPLALALITTAEAFEGRVVSLSDGTEAVLHREALYDPKSSRSRV
ncbi:MAG: aminomethyltransferase family protein [Rhodobacteraceae bacterium]|nr:aminomethyltransferase family protein [Paracoccaceae bacterium]